MAKRFYILDERDAWHAAACEAARRYGYEPARIKRAEEVPAGAELGFIRPHADPNVLAYNRHDFQVMQERCAVMIQDAAQIHVYEDKYQQLQRWARYMPLTWRFSSKSEALAFAQGYDGPWPIISKADHGASSVNVRVLRSAAELRFHVLQIFGKGIPVNHCSGGYKSTQRDYIMLQEFIPHRITWRINRVGNTYAIFKRYCHPAKPLAQTGNVAPVLSLDDSEANAATVTDLLRYAQAVTDDIGSKWVALDVLVGPPEGQGERFTLSLLETSLAWPWPSPGDCDKAPFFYADGTQKAVRWDDLFGNMFSEVEAGAWRIQK
jgi:glutathione synthase/RimK-type ligase-like ATP-grasp enzyme